MSRSDDEKGFERETALLSWIQQFAPYGVITLDRALRVRSWNHWMEAHSSLQFQEVVGQDILRLFPDLERRRLVSAFARALQGESSVLSTVLHRYLLELPSPLRDPLTPHMLQTARIAPLVSHGEICGVVVVIEDVTQRESQAETLNRRHRRDEVRSWALAHFLESDRPRNAIRPLFFKIAEHLDFDTFFLYMNDAETGALTLYTFGGIPEHLESEFARYPLFVKAAESHEPVIFNSVRNRTEPEFESLKKARISAAMAIPLVSNDHALGLLCFATWSRESIADDELDLLRTISQYLATAIDRENTNRQLQKAKEQLAHHAQHLEEQVRERTLRLQETISELETFSYTLAHDLKAPVRGMIGYCEVLLEDFGAALPPEVSSIIQKMERAPRRMDLLIRDLLRFSEISRGAVALSRVEIEPVVEDVLSLRTPLVRQSTKICHPLHPVLAHKALLHQVLANLIDNAMKFVTPENPPTITISTEVIHESSPPFRPESLLFNSPEPSREAAARPPANGVEHIRIWVRDEGIGIPADIHKKIFGVFERGVSGNFYEGTGMGLAIVARAMQRMGGTCGVESAPGKGSGFWLELSAA